MPRLNPYEPIQFPWEEIAMRSASSEPRRVMEEAKPPNRADDQDQGAGGSNILKGSAPLKAEASVNLYANDKTKVTATYRACQLSNTLRVHLEDVGFDGTGEWSVQVPIDGKTLELTMDWLTYHSVDAQGPTTIAPDLSSWDYDFLRVKQSQIFSLILAADYLDAPGMQDLMCIAAGAGISEKTPDEMRHIFGIGPSTGAKRKDLSYIAELILRSTGISKDIREKLSIACGVEPKEPKDRNTPRITQCRGCGCCTFGFDPISDRRRKKY